MRCAARLFFAVSPTAAYPDLFLTIFCIPPPPPDLLCARICCAQGHLEFFICNSEDQSDGPEGVVNQGCFNMYPLTRASDDSDASPIDPDYPGRYYVDPPCREDETDQTKPDGAEPGPINTARYQLPEGLICERCIVQMVYCELYLAIVSCSQVAL